ncbi:glutaredoxin 3 [Yoonia sp. 208BN28-4]|uniref:glutaredoxin 3 n=1 Tax=Yoonia sp. 208BN28-4 TaxID=3126505 RepID=UPI0030B02355
MKPVEIYMKPTCGFCHAAIRLLDSKNVGYTTVNILAQPDRRAEMIQRANGRSTVPQIFIGGEHVGGYDDLNALHGRGKLDAMLAS